MTVLGLTGGIGTGKSTVAAFLTQRGIPVADTDAIARALVEPGQPALEAVRLEFGDRFLDADGRLRRAALAELVFNDSEARRRLEAILHPRIRDAWQRDVEAWRAAGQRLAVVVIPLLFETGAEAAFDAVVCTACTRATQEERLLARGWSREEIDRRLQAQLGSVEKMARADRVIWTEGRLEVTRAQVERLFSR